MTPKVLVPIANGSEDIEAVCIIDILRRSGAQVTVASVDGPEVVLARGLMVRADGIISDYEKETFDLVALPGGIPGAEHLRDSPVLKKILQRQREQSLPVAAICAAPVVVLQHHGFLEGKRATCHPSFVSQLNDQRAAEEDVVFDGGIVTSRGVGTAIRFSLKLVEILFGPDKSMEVARAIVAD